MGKRTSKPELWNPDDTAAKRVAQILEEHPGDREYTTWMHQLQARLERGGATAKQDINDAIEIAMYGDNEPAAKALQGLFN